MHIFLTGGTGTIGSAVLHHAVAAGHSVTALSRGTKSDALLSAAGATPLRSDLSEPDRWIPAAVQADAFIHLASTFDDTMAMTEPRLIRSLTALTAPRPTPLRMIYTGGCWLYGQTGNAVATDTSPFNPIAAFAWATQAIATLKNTANLSLATVHPAMIYTEAGGVFSRMITALRARRPAPIWGSEHTRWPLVHAADAARAYLMLATTPGATGRFNIVAEQGVPTGDIAATLSAQAGITARPAILPRKWALARHGAWGEGPMLDQNMAAPRLRSLGWTPAFTDYRTLTYAV